MKELPIIYRFKDDKDAINRLQKASKDKKSEYGLKIENELLIGTQKWFRAIDNGLIKKYSIRGTITKVYMSGHNDYPEFEMECNGEKSTWTREGKDELYKQGKEIELTYVIQKFKRSKDIIGSTKKMVIEIRIE